MPVIRDIPMRLKTREVLRRQGLGGGAGVRPEIGILVRQLLATVEKRRLLEPAVAYEIYAVTDTTQRQLSLDSGLADHDPFLRSLLSGAKEMAIAVCTIGPGLEKQVTEYTNQGEPLRGMLLDGIGSAAVDSLAEEFRGFVANEASSRGYEAGGPINPGMPGLPITAQWRLLELVPAQEIGVSLTSSGMMIPRKSVSMVMGIGPQMAKWSRAEVCARCSLRETCHYKLTK
jgi:cobalamin-dependent methionine synthase I